MVDKIPFCEFVIKTQLFPNIGMVDLEHYWIVSIMHQMLSKVLQPVALIWFVHYPCLHCLNLQRQLV